MQNKKYKITYLPLFKRDLNSIMDYIIYKLENKEAALSLLESIESAIINRSKSPLSFEKHYSILERKYPYHKINVKNFIIFYVVIEDTIELRRILYGKRDIDKLI